MLVFGTEMHIVTFLFVCIELVILFYLVIYQLARPDDKSTILNLILIILLMAYNVAGGLFPDPDLPGSFFLQMAIAYGTGFITPSYFPYYVYKAFLLEKMKFHAYKGVFVFLLFPYVIFVAVMTISGSLDIAKNLLVLPVLYATWVIYSLLKAIRYKYNNFKHKESKEETAVLLLSLTPWIGLPVIDYFDAGQVMEVMFTNIGFLLLLALQVKNHVKSIREEHSRLIESEQRLLTLNNDLQLKVEKITSELENTLVQQSRAFAVLSDEIQAPLDNVNNTLEMYGNSPSNDNNLSTVKPDMDKLSNSISNLCELGKLHKGISTYNTGIISNFGIIIKDSLLLLNTMLSSMVRQSQTGIDEQQSFKKNCERFNLTRREMEIANLINKGQSNKEIADTLFISIHTVGKHVEHLFAKVGAGNKIELINKLK